MVKNRRIWRKRRTWVDWILNSPLGWHTSLKVDTANAHVSVRIRKQAAVLFREVLSEFAVREDFEKLHLLFGCKGNTFPLHTQIIR